MVTAGRWLRVTRQNRCPVCGKPDWCLVSPDGEAAICARIESEETVGNKGAEIILGGFGSDVLQGGLFDISTDIILGDNGVVIRKPDGGSKNDIYSTDLGIGGDDILNKALLADIMEVCLGAQDDTMPKDG